LAFFSNDFLEYVLFQVVKAYQATEVVNKQVLTNDFHEDYVTAEKELSRHLYLQKLQTCPMLYEGQPNPFYTKHDNDVIEQQEGVEEEEEEEQQTTAEETTIINTNTATTTYPVRSATSSPVVTC